MWFRLARNGLLTRALACVLTAIVAGGAIDWGHSGNDDAACSPALVLHDHGAHRFRTPGTPAAPDHCYICHSLRLLHGALAAAVDRFELDLSSSGTLRVAAPLTRSFDLTARASRAPPADRL